MVRPDHELKKIQGTAGGDSCIKQLHGSDNEARFPFFRQQRDPVPDKISGVSKGINAGNEHVAVTY